MSKKTNKLPNQVVNITSPALNSRLGQYFIGQSELLKFGTGYNAWGAVVNPIDSAVNLYIDIFTITNFSDQSFIAEVWLNANTPINSAVSHTVTSSNQSISPLPKPTALMKYAYYLTEAITSGVNIFGRIVGPNSTLVSDSHNGSIIIAPGGSFSILLRPPVSQPITGTIVLTWWEEAIGPNSQSRTMRR